MEIDDLWNSEHMRQYYTSIYGKLIYPVAINPLDSPRKKDCKNKKILDKCRVGHQYYMVRGWKCCG